MKRATITLNDELERAVDAYLRDQEARPSLTAVVQTALRQYLTDADTSARANDCE